MCGVEKHTIESKFAREPWFCRWIPARYAVSFVKRTSMDIRGMWEHFRHYGSTSVFLSPTAKPYEKDKAMDSIVKFYATHRTGYGVAWGCAMESSYRLFNLLLIRQIALQDESGLNRIECLDRYLIIECEFICEHLEEKANNNHYLLNIASLLACEHLKNGRLNSMIKNLDAIERFKKIVSHQFQADGSHFESSSAYHFLCIEAVALAVAGSESARGIWKSLPPRIRQGAVEMLHIMLNRDGSALQIGDDDSSSIFFTSDFLPKRYLQYKIITKLLPDALCRNVEMSPRNEFLNFGVIYRRVGRIEIFLYAPSHGQNGKGGHAHNDKGLSLIHI